MCLTLRTLMNLIDDAIDSYIDDCKEKGEKYDISVVSWPYDEDTPPD